MDGIVAAFEQLDSAHLREASWLDRERDKQNVASTGPPIWRWSVPLAAPGLRVDAYLGSALRENLSQDALVVAEGQHRIVLGVADGVTPTARTPAVDGRDGARFAACTVLAQVARAVSGDALHAAFLVANEALITQFAATATRLDQRDRPQAAAIAAALDVTRDGTIADMSVVRAADCDVWTRTGRRWSLVSTTPMFTEQTRRDLELWAKRNPGATLAERLEMERKVITRYACWNLTALGRFEKPKLQCRAVEADFDDLVLVTDGSDVRRAVADGLSEPHDWLTGLRSWEASNRPSYKRHDDVAMLHLRRLAPEVSRR